MELRFVILEHDPTPRALRNSAPQPPHWDLMIERSVNGKLVTWRLDANPLTGDSPVSADPIGDHRREYLTFEGELSGDRGRVRRIEAGTAKWIELSEERARFSLEGTSISGEFRIARDSTGRWTFELTTDG